MLPQPFRHQPRKVPNPILLKIPANNLNPQVAKGLSRRIRLLSLIISLTPTLRISITVRLTVPDTFLSLSSNTLLCFSLDPLGQDRLVIPPQSSLEVLVYNLRHLTMEVCINKQDTTNIKPTNIRSTNTPTALVSVKA